MMEMTRRNATEVTDAEAEAEDAEDERLSALGEDLLCLRIILKLLSLMEISSISGANPVSTKYCTSS